MGDKEAVLRLSKPLAVMGLGLVVAALLAACGPAGEPDIELGSNQVDLGTVRNGTVEEFSVQVINVGNAPLVIEAVSTSCGCTSASVTPESIGPGGIGELKVVYDSGAHGPEFSGQVQRQVYIASNDPASREEVLNFQVEVTRPES